MGEEKWDVFKVPNCFPQGSYSSQRGKRCYYKGESWQAHGSRLMPPVLRLLGSTRPLLDTIILAKNAYAHFKHGETSDNPDWGPFSAITDRHSSKMSRKDWQEWQTRKDWKNCHRSETRDATTNGPVGSWVDPGRENGLQWKNVCNANSCLTGSYQCRFLCLNRTVDVNSRQARWREYGNPLYYFATFL